ncbi:hypothetical protein FACS189430_04040 [Bacteroidia bacterium]|nr:hypothetical protein FACS189430_04040 [Bacteroidia bacterium]
MKKQRGLKRYYQNLKTKNDFANWDRFDFNKYPDAWFDCWHWHIDWRAYGNHSFKKRKPHLDKLFRHFAYIEEKIKSYHSEFQFFILLLDYNAASDAIFLHTPNPNKNNFPLQWENLTNESTLTNKQLVDYVKKLEGYEILYGTADEAFCILFKKGIGNNHYEQSAQIP